MPLLIDSAPDCIKDVDGAVPADDTADFIVQAPYEECAGFMTFGPGTVYGEGGAGAATQYYVLTLIGAAVTLAVLAYWVLWEDRRLRAWARRRAADTTAPSD